jgi:uncharacterized membrane protein
MTEILIEYFNQFPHWLATIILSALPITELRLTIPVALEAWNLSILSAFMLAIVGNLIPLIPLYFGLDWFRGIIAKYLPSATNIVDKLIARTEKKVKNNYVKYGAIALCIFTAIPLPMTGLWSATIAAVALKIPFKNAAPSIALGVVIAGIIVTILTVSSRVVF